MNAKPKVREMARILRKNGKSIKAIAKELNVSQGSVSPWVKDIELTQEQIDNLNSYRYASKKIATKALVEKHLLIRKEFQEKGRTMAKSKDPEFISGCMLYWAEGTKSRSRLVFTNSDVHMLKFFIGFLKKSFGLTNDDFRINCHFYINDGLSFEDVENYWKEQLSLPESCYRKTSVNKLPRKATTKRKITTKYGVCKIVVYKQEIVQMIYGALQEFVGFTNEDWVL